MKLSITSGFPTNTPLSRYARRKEEFWQRPSRLYRGHCFFNLVTRWRNSLSLIHGFLMIYMWIRHHAEYNDYVLVVYRDFCELIIPLSNALYIIWSAMIGRCHRSNNAQRASVNNKRYIAINSYTFKVHLFWRKVSWCQSHITQIQTHQNAIILFKVHEVQRSKPLSPSSPINFKGIGP